MERKRTTVYLDPYLLRTAKKTAALQGRNLQQILNEALQKWLGIVRIPSEKSAKKEQIISEFRDLAERAAPKWDRVSAVQEIRNQRKKTSP